ncbi:MAG: hypothetical protein HQ522_23205, partial [Bacteroidetes bacterium]|nr:hypothetical protein [Bacteroidota bacterium]
SDYPFTHDNNWFISYFVESNLNALAIFNNNPDLQEGLNYISALFENDDYIKLDKTNINSLQISKLSEYNTIFLMNLENFSSGFLNELEKAVKNGTSVVLFPGNRNNPNFNNTFLSQFNANRIIGTDSTKQKISGIDFENNFFKDVFKKKEQNPIFPEIDGHLKFEKNIRTSESRLLWFQNNDKALSTLKYEMGKVWVFSFPLEKKNDSFAHDVLFVPTLYNIVLNSIPDQENSFIVGQNTFYDLSKDENINLNSSIEIENKVSGEKFIPSKNVSTRGTRLEFAEQISEAGHYLIQNDNSILSAMAFNYNRKESDLRYFNSIELQDKIEVLQLKNATIISNVESNFSEVFEDIQNGKQLWEICILLALLFILIEVLISRFWK